MVMTGERKSRIWELSRKGTTMSLIARDTAKPPVTVFLYPLYHGGISPRTRTRSAKCLSAGERESISRGMSRGTSYRAIGRQLGLSASTISREVGRNGGPGKYRRTMLKSSSSSGLCDRSLTCCFLNRS